MAAKTKQATKKAAAGGRKAPARKPAAKSAARKQPAKKQPAPQKKHRLSSQSKALLLLAGAVLLLFIIFIPGENVWRFLHSFMLGLFGTLAVLWPVLLIYVAVMTALDKQLGTKMAGKTALAIGFIVFLSSLMYIL